VRIVVNPPHESGRAGASVASGLSRLQALQPFDIHNQQLIDGALVGPDGVADDDALDGWIQRSVKFVMKLPAKEK
jgi:hypothetical protein